MIPRLNKDSPLCPHVNMTDSTKTMSHTPWMGWGGRGRFHQAPVLRVLLVYQLLKFITIEISLLFEIEIVS